MSTKWSSSKLHWVAIVISMAWILAVLLKVMVSFNPLNQLVAMPQTTAMLELFTSTLADLMKHNEWITSSQHSGGISIGWLPLSRLKAWRVLWCFNWNNCFISECSLRPCMFLESKHPLISRMIKTQIIKHPFNYHHRLNSPCNYQPQACL